MLSKTNGHGPRSIGPTDRLVAARIVAARKEASVSQSALAEVLGITFQQVQKYEKGVNRVGADRLHTIAEKLGKPVAWFFADAPARGGAVDDNVTAVVRLMGSNADIRAIMSRLPRLDREDAKLVATMVERLTA